ncbi:unnamed protein product [Acanthoscelides obtectus]|uniref:MADF domain-containing protein n=1 Tax=Acanthoscelides obtectus TaxID=200917 RepID=A0A9P0M1Q5_ACAOB|nr:unnamed protein product [Acanthoscelides obtectus]CAK1680516.1 hypothetical protein AOBTE_LOCUS32718 [Acanthoscelides obtectus]
MVISGTTVGGGENPEGYGGQIVKELWRKLRDCHRDALRRQRKSKSGDKAKNIKLWTYQKQMEFLIPYMANRSTTGNIESNQQDGAGNLTDNDDILSPSVETAEGAENEDETGQERADHVHRSSRD